MKKDSYFYALRLYVPHRQYAMRMLQNLMSLFPPDMEKRLQTILYRSRMGSRLSIRSIM